jgi:putative ABC transport system ATP-binding protein
MTTETQDEISEETGNDTRDQAREKVATIYELHDVSRKYRQNGKGVVALDSIDLTIAAGELVAVQGSTGSGKTTLLQVLGALDRPTSGSVLFRGEDLARLSERRLAPLRSRAFGFVFQTFNLIPTLTARENVETALVPFGVGTGERRRRAQSALDDVGLGDRATHLPSELSGGEQQRVAIARALVKDPQVILADEPTGNLDERMRDELIALLERLWRERDLTVLIVTHDSTVAARASRRLWMHEGRLVEDPDSAA